MSVMPLTAHCLEAGAANLNAHALICSDVEATLLAALVGVDSLVGLADPFSGWLSEDIYSAWQASLARLRDHGLIQSGANEGPCVDSTAARLISVWGQCDSAVLLSSRGPADSETCRFYIGLGSCVEDRVEAGVTHHLMDAVKSDVSGKIQSLARLDSWNAAPGSRFSVPTEVWEHPLAQNGRDLRVQAEELELVPRDFAEALDAPTLSTFVLAMKRRQRTWETAGLGFLAGDAGLWRFRPTTKEGKSALDVIPAGGPEAVAELQKLLTRAIR